MPKPFKSFHSKNISKLNNEQRSYAAWTDNTMTDDKIVKILTIGKRQKKTPERGFRWQYIDNTQGSFVQDQHCLLVWNLQKLKNNREHRTTGIGNPVESEQKSPEIEENAEVINYINQSINYLQYIAINVNNFHTVFHTGFAPENLTSTHLVSPFIFLCVSSQVRVNKANSCVMKTKPNGNSSFVSLKKRISLRQ